MDIGLAPSPTHGASGEANVSVVSRAIWSYATVECGVIHLGSSRRVSALTIHNVSTLSLSLCCHFSHL